MNRRIVSREPLRVPYNRGEEKKKLSKGLAGKESETAWGDPVLKRFPCHAMAVERQHCG